MSFNISRLRLYKAEHLTDMMMGWYDLRIRHHFDNPARVSYEVEITKSTKALDEAESIPVELLSFHVGTASGEFASAELALDAAHAYVWKFSRTLMRRRPQFRVAPYYGTDMHDWRAAYKRVTTRNRKLGAVKCLAQKAINKLKAEDKALDYERMIAELGESW